MLRGPAGCAGTWLLFLQSQTPLLVGAVGRAMVMLLYAWLMCHAWGGVH